MENKKYNGWENWDTWNACLWLTNDEWSDSEARKCSTTQKLKEFWIYHFEGKDDIDTSEINFEEIFEAITD